MIIHTIFLFFTKNYELRIMNYELNLLNLQIKVQSYKKIYKNSANCNHNFSCFIDYSFYFVE